MKTFRIIYWTLYTINECYIKADTEDEAIQKFTMAEPRATISSIEEVEVKQ